MQRIQLGNAEFEGRNNAYLFTGDGPTTLLDTGIATDSTRDSLTSALRSQGLALDDIDRILLTHWHEDHAGLSGLLQSLSDSDVHCHPADQPIIERQDEYITRLRASERSRFDEWGIPPEKQRELSEQIAAADDVHIPPARTIGVEENAIIAAGDRSLRALHTPGHTAGHLSFFDPANNALFSGDALLPEYTPNIGGADIRVDRPLRTYLRTLCRFSDLAPDRAHPGHRGPISEPLARTRETIHHHAHRTRRVLDAVHNLGRADPWTVSHDLFGSLEGVHIIHGPGEAYAHLAELEAIGAVSKTRNEYSVTADAETIVRSHFTTEYATDPYQQ